MLLLLAGAAHAGDLYLYIAPDGTPVLTDTPRHAGFEVWWDENPTGQMLSTGVRLPRLDRIEDLDLYDADFVANQRRTGVPAELLKAVCIAESRMNPNAVSPAGARGLMQIIPSTARALGVTDSFDPTQSITGGATYLAKQVETFGSYPLAVAAYNAGPGAVHEYDGIPPYAETQTYVKRVIGLYEHLRDNRPIQR